MSEKLSQYLTLFSLLFIYSSLFRNQLVSGGQSLSDPSTPTKSGKCVLSLIFPSFSQFQRPICTWARSILSFNICSLGLRISTPLLCPDLDQSNSSFMPKVKPGRALCVDKLCLCTRFAALAAQHLVDLS